MTKSYTINHLIINRLYLQKKSFKISNFKEKFTAFSMKTTDSKDLVKVNPTLPIIQEYFGNSMNLARIKLMAYIAPRTLCGAGCKPSQTGFGNAYVG